MTYIYVALIIALGGILPLLTTNHFRFMRLAGSATIASGCILGFILSIMDLLDKHVYYYPYKLFSKLSFSFKIDPLSLFFLVPLFLVGAMVAIYSYNYLDNNEKRTRISTQYFFLSSLIISMVGVVISNSIISFSFFWEAMSVTSAALVLFEYEKKDNRRAAFHYFVFSQVSGLFIFISFGILYSYTNSFELLASGAIPSKIRLIIFLMAMIGFGSKAGLIPLHVWLPHAHPAAPCHVSALMSGVMIKLGIYGLIRVFFLLHPDPEIVGRIFIITGTISGILGVVYALGQHNLKRLLAYHSVENMGIIILGIGIGMIGIACNNPPMALMGFCGGILHVWNHALFKSVLFLCSGNILHKTNTLHLDHLGGLLKKMKGTGIIFLIGAVAICGLPPLNGFVSEFFIYYSCFQGIIQKSPNVLFITLVILSLAAIGGLAIACFTKVFGVVFLGESRKLNVKNITEVKTFMLIPIGILALLCIAIGILPNLFIRPALLVVTSLTDQNIVASTIDMSLCTNISISGICFLILILALFIIRAYLYKDKSIERSPTWGCGFTKPSARMQYTASSFARSILIFFSPFTRASQNFSNFQTTFPPESKYHSIFHDIVELFGDQYINKPLSWIANKLRLIQQGSIQIYIAYIVFTLIIIIFFQIR